MQPVLYAVLSDIHANFPALKAVETDAVNVARALNAQSLHFVVLGDVVDYGPQPNECMDWITEHAEIVIQGNHDMDVMDSAYKPPHTISREYWPITIWTRAVLSREHRGRIREWQPGLCRLNSQLPVELKDFMLFHSSLKYGHHGTVKTSQDAWENLDLIRKEGITYGLFGHTHIQGYFVNSLPLWEQHKKDTTLYLICPEHKSQRQRNGTSKWKPAYLESAPETKATGCTPWETLPAHPALFNPGAAGQPRLSSLQDRETFHDPRAAYMLLKSNGQMQFQFRRTAYDVDETIRSLREDVYWPPDAYQNRRGSDILREEGATTDMLNTLPADFLSIVHKMKTMLPNLVERVLVPQLR
ncbi:MAG TPA: metallophosphoesterase family protein [Anaerolineae bacterium]|nr:metallophosphoesterase family protein [Anaerolineae bacterium]HQH36938.1 metallophosphoesterase family protein [Anaerolineae bacterium]